MLFMPSIKLILATVKIPSLLAIGKIIISDGIVVIGNAIANRHFSDSKNIVANILISYSISLKLDDLIPAVRGRCTANYGSHRRREGKIKKIYKHKIELKRFYIVRSLLLLRLHPHRIYVFPLCNNRGFIEVK